MAEHTPAPWKGFPNVSGSNPSKRTVVAGDYADEGEPDMLVEVFASNEEVDANARLIAAAPSLYEAAHMVLQANDAERPHLMWAAIEALRSAFNEARGEEEI